MNYRLWTIGLLAWSAAAGMAQEPLPAGALAQCGRASFAHPAWFGNLVWMRLTADGRWLVTANETTCKCWETATGQLRWTRPHSHLPTALVLSADNRWLAGEINGQVQLVDLLTGQLVRTLTNATAPLCFSHHHRWIATRAKGQRHLLLFELNANQPPRTLATSSLTPSSLAISNDHQTLTALGRLPTGELSIGQWSVADGQCCGECSIAAPGPIRGALLAPDGSWLAALSGVEVRVLTTHSTATGRVLATADDADHRRRLLAIGPDGTLATLERGDPATELDLVMIYEPRTLRVLRTVSVPGRIGNLLAITPGAKRLLLDQRGQALFFDGHTGLREHNTDDDIVAHRLCWSKTGQTLLTDTVAGVVVEWDAATGRRQQSWPMPPGTHLLAWDQGETLICGPRIGPWWRVHWTTGQREPLPRPVFPDGRKVEKLAWDFWHCDAAQRLTALSRYHVLKAQTLCRWSQAGAQLATDWPTDLTAELRLPAGNFLCRNQRPHPNTKGDDQRRRHPAQHHFSVVEPDAGRVRLTLNLPGPVLLHLSASADQRTLVSLTADVNEQPSTDELTQLWLRGCEFATGQPRFAWPINPTPPFARPNALALAPDGLTAAVSRNDATLELWDVRTGTRRARHSATDSRVEELHFAPDGRRLASRHANGTVVIWPVPALAELPAADPTNAWDALASADGVAAFQALACLAQPNGVAFLATRLQPAVPVRPEQLQQWLADLDHPRFAVRQAAQKALAHAGPQAQPFLRQVAPGQLSAEQRRQIEILLNAEAFVSPGDELRHLRALEALERADTPAARVVVQQLASGAPLAWRTQAAQATRARWTP
jgi:WD40 repeat protein